MWKKIVVVVSCSLLLAGAVQAADVNRLAGRLLLVVDRSGELWYVQPNGQQAVYLGQASNFLSAMRSLALGITETDLQSFKAQAPKRLAGRFLLRTEAGGKIAYVNPVDLQISFFDDNNAALAAMRGLALGVKYADVASLLSATVADAAVNRTTAASQVAGMKILTAAEAVSAAQKFVSAYLVNPDATVTVKSLGQSDGLYQLSIAVSDNQPIVAAISQDGQRFYPQILNIADYQSATPEASVSAAPKANKPTVELFVMSYCPYGTQMEKGILPVVKALGDKLDFQVKFVDYAMHGDKEIKENLRQYCLQQQSAVKYQSYLQCFDATGDNAGCLTQSQVDQSALSACVSQTDAQYQITAAAVDQNQWTTSFPPFNIQHADNVKYAVQGSPTLVVNGETVTSSRDSASLAKVLCQAFIDSARPAACNQSFSSVTPGPGFGTAAASGDSAAACATP